MKYLRLLPLLAVVLLLSGCALFDGAYVSVTPHLEQAGPGRMDAVDAQNYEELVKALERLVSSGTEVGVINLTNYNHSLLERNLREAVAYIRQTYPIGAYAVEDLEYELGTSGGRPAVALNITYLHSRMEIQRIRRVSRMESAEELVYQSLDNCDASLVMLVGEYEERDFTQLVQSYAEANPQSVMETPLVTSGTYGVGTAKVVELTFTYQNSRESLRGMQNQVQDVFDSAALYVTGDGLDRQKLSQLYSFLMERFDYTLETSITPSYSLLRHGVGDSRAFALVYSAMCRQAGLECMIVTGSRNGEPRTWNIVLDNGRYYHVDLLRASGQGGFREYVDSEMGGYVWDYSAYPVCAAVYTEPAPSAPAETHPQETQDAEQTDVLEESEDF